MRNAQSFEALSSISQDPFYDELKQRILNAPTLPALCAELDAMRAFREEEIPNMRLWIPVLNKLDAALESLLLLHGEELLLPIVDSRGGLSIPPSLPASAIASLEACSQLKAILRWTTRLLHNSIHREHYLSFEVKCGCCFGDEVLSRAPLDSPPPTPSTPSPQHVQRCLRAYDDELAALALELLATACIQQYNHRHVMIHNIFTLYSAQREQADFSDFYDILSAAQSANIRRPKDIIDLSKSGISDAATCILDISFPPRRFHVPTPAPANQKDVAKMFWPVQSPDDTANLDNDPAVCVLRDVMATVDLSIDARSLQDLMRFVVATLTSASLMEENGDSHQFCSKLAQVNVYMFQIMWRLRFARLQNVAGNPWLVQLHVFQALHIIASSHTNENVVCHYFWAQGSGRFMADIGVVMNNLDVAACCESLVPSLDPESIAPPVPYNVAFWTCTTVASLMSKTEELAALDDDDQSNPDLPKRKQLLPPFTTLLQEIGLEKHQIAGCIPTLLKKEVNHFLAAEGETEADLATTAERLSRPRFAAAEQKRVYLFEHILIAILSAVTIHGVPTTLVDNGVISLLLSLVAVPQPHSFLTGSSGKMGGNPGEPLCHESERDILQKVALQRRSDPCKSLRLCVVSFSSQILDRIICKKAPRDMYNTLSGQSVHFSRLVYEAKLLRYIPDDIPISSPISLDGIRIPSERVFPRSATSVQALQTGPQLSEKSLLLSLLSMTNAYCSDSRNADVNDLVRSPRFLDTMKTIFSLGTPFSAALLTTALNLVESLISFDPAPPGVLTYFIKVGLIGCTWEAVQAVRVNLDDDTITSMLDFVQSICVVEAGVAQVLSFNCFKFMFSELSNPNRMLSESQSASGESVGEKIGALLRYYPALAPQCMTELLNKMHSMCPFNSAVCDARMPGYQRVWAQDIVAYGETMWWDPDLEKVLIAKSMLHCLEFIFEESEASVEAFLSARIPQLVSDPLTILFTLVLHMLGPSDDFFLHSVAALHDESLSRDYLETDAGVRVGVDTVIGSFNEILRNISQAQPSKLFGFITNMCMPQMMQHIQTSVVNFTQVMKAPANQPRAFLMAVSDSSADLDGSFGTYLYNKDQLSSIVAPEQLTAAYVSFLQKNAFVTVVLDCLAVTVTEAATIPSSYYYDNLTELLVPQGTSIVSMLDYFVNPATNGFRLIAEQILLARVDRLGRLDEKCSEEEEEKQGHLLYRLVVIIDKLCVRDGVHKGAKRLTILDADAVVYATRMVHCRESEDAVWFQLQGSGGWIRRRSKGDFENVQVAGLKWVPGSAGLPAEQTTVESIAPFEKLLSYRSPRQSGIIVMDLLLQSISRFMRATTRLIHTRLLKKEILFPKAVPGSVALSTELIENVAPNIANVIGSLLVLSNVGSILPSVMSRQSFADIDDHGSFTAAHVVVLYQAFQLALANMFGQGPHGPRELLEVTFVQFLAVANPFPFDSLQGGMGSGCLFGGLLQASAALVSVCMPYAPGLKGDRAIHQNPEVAWEMRRTVAIDGLTVVVSLWKCLLEEKPTLQRKRDASFFSSCQHDYDIQALWEDATLMILHQVSDIWQDARLFTLPPHLYSAILELQSILFVRSNRIFKSLASKERLRVGRLITEDKLPDAPWLEFLLVQCERDVGAVYVKVLSDQNIVLPPESSILARIASSKSYIENMSMIEDTLEEYKKEEKGHASPSGPSASKDATEEAKVEKSEDDNLKHANTSFVEALPPDIQADVLLGAEKDFLQTLPQKFIDMARELGSKNALSIPNVLTSRPKTKSSSRSSKKSHGGGSMGESKKATKMFKVLPYPLPAKPQTLHERLDIHSSRMWKLLQSIRLSLLSLCSNWMHIPLVKAAEGENCAAPPDVWSIHTFLDAKAFREGKFATRVGVLNFLLEKVVSQEMFSLLETDFNMGVAMASFDRLNVIVIVWLFDALRADVSSLRKYYENQESPRAADGGTKKLTESIHGCLVCLVMMMNGQSVDDAKVYAIQFDVMIDLFRNHDFFLLPRADLLWLLQHLFSSPRRETLDFAFNGMDSWAIPAMLLLDTLTRVIAWTPDHSEIMMHMCSCVSLSFKIIRHGAGEGNEDAYAEDSFKMFFTQFVASPSAGSISQLDALIQEKVRENFAKPSNGFNGTFKHDGGSGSLVKLMPQNQIGAEATLLLRCSLNAVGAAVDTRCAELLQGALQLLLHVVAGCTESSEHSAEMLTLTAEIGPRLLQFLFPTMPSSNSPGTSLSSFHYPGLAATVASIVQAVDRLSQNCGDCTLRDGRADLSSPLAVKVLQLYTGAIQHVRNTRNVAVYTGDNFQLQQVCSAMKNVFIAMPATCLRVIASFQGQTALLSRNPKSAASSTVGCDASVRAARSAVSNEMYINTGRLLNEKIKEAFSGFRASCDSGSIESLENFNQHDQNLAALLLITADIAYSLSSTGPSIDSNSPRTLDAMEKLLHTPKYPSELEFVSLSFSNSVAADTFLASFSFESHTGEGGVAVRRNIAEFIIGSGIFELGAPFRRRTAQLRKERATKGSRSSDAAMYLLSSMACISYGSCAEVLRCLCAEMTRLSREVPPDDRLRAAFGLFRLVHAILSPLPQVWMRHRNALDEKVLCKAVVETAFIPKLFALLKALLSDFVDAGLDGASSARQQRLMKGMHYTVEAVLSFCRPKAVIPIDLGAAISAALKLESSSPQETASREEDSSDLDLIDIQACLESLCIGEDRPGVLDQFVKTRPPVAQAPSIPAAENSCGQAAPVASSFLSNFLGGPWGARAESSSSSAPSSTSALPSIFPSLLRPYQDVPVFLPLPSPLPSPLAEQQPEIISSPAAPVLGVDGLIWNCLLCTFENSTSCAACDMCGHARKPGDLVVPMATPTNNAHVRDDENATIDSRIDNEEDGEWGTDSDEEGNNSAPSNGGHEEDEDGGDDDDDDDGEDEDDEDDEDEDDEDEDDEDDEDDDEDDDDDDHRHYHHHPNQDQGSGIRIRGGRRSPGNAWVDGDEIDASEESRDSEGDQEDEGDEGDEDDGEGTDLLEEEESDDDETTRDSSLWQMSDEDVEDSVDDAQEVILSNVLSKEESGMLSHKHLWDHPLLRRARRPDVESYQLKGGISKETARFAAHGPHYGERYWGNDVLISSRSAAHLVNLSTQSLMEILIKKLIEDDETYTDHSTSVVGRATKWRCTVCAGSVEVEMKDSDIACPACKVSRCRAPSPPSSGSSGVKFIDLLDSDVLCTSILLKEAREGRSVLVWKSWREASLVSSATELLGSAAAGEAGAQEPQQRVAIGLERQLTLVSGSGSSLPFPSALMISLVLHVVSCPRPPRLYSRMILKLLLRIQNLHAFVPMFGELPEHTYFYNGSRVPGGCVEKSDAEYSGYVISAKRVVSLFASILERDGKGAALICVGSRADSLDADSRRILSRMEQAVNNLPQNTGLLYEILVFLFKFLRFISYRSDYTGPDCPAYELKCVDWDCIMGPAHVHFLSKHVVFDPLSSSASSGEDKFQADGKISPNHPTLLGRLMIGVFDSWKSCLHEPSGVSNVLRVFWRICRTRSVIEDTTLREMEDVRGKRIFPRISVDGPAISAICNIFMRPDCCRDNIYARLEKIVSLVCVPPYSKNDVVHNSWGDKNWENVVHAVRKIAGHLLGEVRHVVLPQAASQLKEHLDIVQSASSIIPGLIFPAPNAELRLLHLLRLASAVLKKVSEGAKQAYVEDYVESFGCIEELDEPSHFSPPNRRATFVRGCLEGIKSDSVWAELTQFLEKLREFEETKESLEKSERESPTTRVPRSGLHGSVDATPSISRVSKGASPALSPGAKQTASSLTTSASGFHFFPLIECFFLSVSADIMVSAYVPTSSRLEAGPRSPSWTPLALVRTTSADGRMGHGGTPARPPLSPARDADVGHFREALGPPLTPTTTDRRGPPIYRELSLPGTRFRDNDAYRAMQLRFDDPQLTSTLIVFAEQNRTLLNAKLRHRIRLLESSMMPLVFVPECRRVLDFTIKRKFISLQLDRLCVGGGGDDDEDVDDLIPLTIDRNAVLEQTFDCFSSRSGKELQRSDMEITFRGEEGIDAGGLTREWYMLVTREIFRASYGLFVQSSDGVTFQPNPKSEIAVGSGHLAYFKFVGRIIGKAICDEQLLDVHFTRAIYKHMLGVPVSYDDLEAFDMDYFKSLRTILSHSLPELGLDLTFSAESAGLGEVALVDLVPNGRNIEVTDDNKAEYVRLIAHHRMTASCRKQVCVGFGVGFLVFRFLNPSPLILPIIPSRLTPFSRAFTSSSPRSSSPSLTRRSLSCSSAACPRLTLTTWRCTPPTAATRATTPSSSSFGAS